MTGNKPDTATMMMGNKPDTATIMGNKPDTALYAASNQIIISFGSEKFHITFDYSSQTGPSVISSEPTDDCFCDDNNTINCSLTQLTMTAYPGEEIEFSVVTIQWDN